MNNNTAISRKENNSSDHATHNLLPELTLHAIALCDDAYGKVTGRLLFDIVRSILQGSDEPLEGTEDTFFNTTHIISYIKGMKQLEGFEKSISEEDRTAWKQMDIEDHVALYLARRAKEIPEFERSHSAIAFLKGKYEPLMGGIRIVTDLAFSGFLMTAVNDPNFATLCKNKDLDTSSMTFEQKMELELDHEALYRYLLNKLGVA